MLLIYGTYALTLAGINFREARDIDFYIDNAGKETLASIRNIKQIQTPRANRMAFWKQGNKLCECYVVSPEFIDLIISLPDTKKTLNHGIEMLQDYPVYYVSPFVVYLIKRAYVNLPDFNDKHIKDIEDLSSQLNKTKLTNQYIKFYRYLKQNAKTKTH